MLELTRAGEQLVEAGTIEQTIRDGLRLNADHPVFIPSTTYRKNGRVVTIHLMEGYAFVASGPTEASFYDMERDSPYIKKVLAQRRSDGFMVLSVLADREIQKMRIKLREAVASDLREGSKVKVVQGAFTHMEGEIVDADGDDATVLFVMRSFHIIRSIPKVFLEPSEDNA